MRKNLVIANWKMHGSKAMAAELLGALIALIETTADVAICPPFVYLEQVAGLLSGSKIECGAQHVHAENGGAFTGEVSASMLQDLGCRYVIVGHSERRSLFAETDAGVAAKFNAVVASGMVPVLCVGETAEEHALGETADVVLRQLNAVIDTAGIDAFEGAVVAYEPVWAIGTGNTATPEQAQEVHRLIRERIEALSANVAERLPILYGGSVKGANAAELFGMPDIDGGLVGGASLDSKEFKAICEAAN